MDYASSLATLAGTMALSVMSPGPNFMVVTSTTMRVSRNAGLMAGLGLAAASLTWALLSVAGLGVILSHAPWAGSLVRLAGGAYLIWIGMKMVLHAREPLEALPAPRTTGGWASLRRAFLVSLGNPKAMAFYGSIFALLVPPHAPLWFGATVLLLAAAISAAWYCGLALVFSITPVRSAFGRAKVYVDTVMGCCLTALGIRLLARS